MGDKFDQFKKGSFNIFRCWSAFRLALENNPQLLTVYYDDERTELEIYYLMRCVLSDIDDEIIKRNSTMAAVGPIGEILLDFVEGYFNVSVEDNSQKFVGEDILKLHSEIFREDKMDFYKQLEKSAANFKGDYSIEFPITRKSVQKKIIEEKERKEKKRKAQEDDDYSGSDFEEVEDEDDANEEVKEVKEEKKPDNKNFSQPDDDGFTTVLKGKKNKEKKTFDKDDLDLIKIDNLNIKEDDGFVEVKKKKKK